MLIREFASQAILQATSGNNPGVLLTPKFTYEAIDIENLLRLNYYTLDLSVVETTMQ
jgi:hypothetical protein